MLRQAWLAVYALLSEPEVRRKYPFTSNRKAALLPLRAQLNEATVDQVTFALTSTITRTSTLTFTISTSRRLSTRAFPSQIPLLVEMQRSLDELSLMQNEPATARPAYMLEQLPELREAPTASRTPSSM